MRDGGLLRAAGSAVVARAVVAVASIGTLAVAAATLPTAQLGVVVVLMTLAAFAGYGDLGLGSVLMSRLPASLARGDAAESRRMVATAVALLVAVGATVGVVGLVSVVVVPWASLLGAQRLDPAAVRWTVAAFLLAVAVLIPATVGGRLLVVLQRSTTANAWTAATGLLTLLATALVGAAGGGMVLFVASTVGVTAAVTSLQTVWVLRVAHADITPTSYRVGVREALGFARSAGGYAVFGVSALVCFAVDSVVVASVLGAAAAAVFGVTARLFAVFSSVIGLAGQQVWSAVADAVARGDVAWARSRYRSAVVVTAAAGLVGGAALVVAGRPLIRIWAGPDVVPPTALLVWFAGWTLVSTTTNQAATLLLVRERVVEIAWAAALMAPVNLGLSLLLTHQLGVVGPLVGSVVAMLVVYGPPVLVLTRRELDALA